MVYVGARIKEIIVDSRQINWARWNSLKRNRCWSQTWQDINL